MTNQIKSKDVTILVCVYNKIDTIENCIKSILNLNWSNKKILIIDNMSTDGSSKILEKYQEKINLIKLPGGYSDILNWAIDNCHTNYIAMTDADCTLDPEWLNELIKGFSDKKVIATAGFCGTPKSASFLQQLIGQEMDTRFKNLPETIFRAPTMNLAFKTKVAEKVKFDKNQLVAVETDFGFRLSKFGKIKYLPKAIVWHHHRSTLKEYFKQQYSQSKWGVRLIFKHKKRAISDPITPLSMTIQIPLLGITLGLLPITTLYSPIILISYITGLTLLLIYIKYILTIKPSLIYSLSYIPFFLFRTFSWLLGVTAGLILIPISTINKTNNY